MTTDYNKLSKSIIKNAQQILTSGKSVAGDIDTTGMGEIGKHVCGKVSEFSFSPETAAREVLVAGYIQFTGIISKLAFGSSEFVSANAAQDKIAEAAESMGFEI